MRHAYLILAHGQPELLQLLVSLLDHPRNDIYIHFDKKWSSPPTLETKQAGLILLTKRIDVRWADVSMLEAEYALFHAVKASGKHYAYHHLLSGVDLPLKSQETIHAFFEKHAGKEFVGMHQHELSYHGDRALHYRHPFARSFRGRGLVFTLKRLYRYLAIEAQILLGQRRNVAIPFHKGGQWVSITTDLLDYLLEREQETLAIYADTFGADEYFIPTLVWNSHFRERLYDAGDESRGAMRYIGWRADGQLTDFTQDDLPLLQRTECLFARKFNCHDQALLREIVALTQQEPKPAPLVSVIIPVYRALETLPQCLEELTKQSHRPLQLIFIDDCSPDASYDYLASQRPLLEAQGIDVTLLRHETNQGVAVARNTGLDAARGEYIYSVDADDRLAPEALARFVLVAQATGADLVSCEYLQAEGAGIRHISQPTVTTAAQAFEQICYGRMKWNLWLWFFRRQLLEQPSPLRFLPKQNMGEDLMLMGRLLQRAQRVEVIHQPLYTYVRSTTQITGTYRPEHWAQVEANVSELQRHLPASAHALLAQLQLTLKRPLLVTGRREDYERWRTMYPESHSQIGHNPVLSSRTRLLELAAMRGQYWYISLYYQVVMRWIYRLLYR